MRWHNHLKNQAPLHSHERQKIALAENDKHSGAKIKLRLHQKSNCVCTIGGKRRYLFRAIARILRNTSIMLHP